jgi:hypothetical protein
MKKVIIPIVLLICLITFVRAMVYSELQAPPNAQSAGDLINWTILMH